MKVWKVILIVLGVLILVFAGSYCIYACSSINNTVDLEFLTGLFVSDDMNDYVVIESSLENSFFKVGSMYYFPSEASYIDNVFIFQAYGEEYYFEACNTDKLYSLSFRNYFYRFEDENYGN